MSQTARAVVKMIARDVRMAGYTEFNKQQITEAVKITDSSGTCCDRIDIIYDKSSSERIKISYYTQQYNNRYRLMKKIDKCTNSDCSSTSTLQSAQPIADYVEDLQFIGSKNGIISSSGAEIWGQGNIRWINPSSVYSPCEDPITSTSATAPDYPGKLTAHGKAIYAIDGDTSTVYSCWDQNTRGNNNISSDGTQNYGNGGMLQFKFPKRLRLIGAEVKFSTNIDGGSHNGTPPKRDDCTNCYESGFANWTFPYAYNRPYKAKLLFRANQLACVFNPKKHSSCQTFSHMKYGLFMDSRTSSNTHYLDSNFVTGKSHYIDYQVFDELDVIITDTNRRCKYNNAKNKCTSVMGSKYYELTDIRFYGEVYGEATIPTEMEIGLLLRSPNEHQTKSKSFSINMGNRSFSSIDRHMRDSFSTSVIVRNLYYASQ